MVNILTEKYRKVMHVKNSESQRKTNTQHLKHPINHHDMKPQNRQRGLPVCSDRGGRCWRVLSCAGVGGGRVTSYKEGLHTLYREFCSRVRGR